MRLSLFCLCGLLALMPVEGPPRSPDERPSGPAALIDRFLAQSETPLTSAIARRHLVATTRGGAMSGWVDACTFQDGREMRYEILAQGGSAAVRKHALIAALDGEVAARRDGDPARAALVPANYVFTPADATGDVLRVALRPTRADALLIEGAMTLARETGELLSLEGQLVKAPSFWTRQVHVTRHYARIQGVRVPVAMESRARVLLVGASTFEMSYAYLSVNETTIGDVSDPAAGCGGSSSQSHRRAPTS